MAPQPSERQIKKARLERKAALAHIGSAKERKKKAASATDTWELGCHRGRGRHPARQSTYTRRRRVSTCTRPFLRLAPLLVGIDAGMRISPCPFMPFVSCVLFAVDARAPACKPGVVSVPPLPVRVTLVCVLECLQATLFGTRT